MTDSVPKKLGNVIQIDEDHIQEHLGTLSAGPWKIRSISCATPIAINARKSAAIPVRDITNVNLDVANEWEIQHDQANG